MYSAESFFSHHGQPISRLRETILEYMGRDPWSGRAIFAYDNFNFGGNFIGVNTPPRRRSIVDSAYREHNINEK